jgi:hypothetical protein
VSEKVGHSKFSTAVGMYLVFGTIAFFVQIFTGGAIILWMPLLFSFVYALSLRMYLVKKEKIATDQPGFITEFCVGFWCFSCSIAQSKKYFIYLFCLMICL